MKVCTVKPLKSPDIHEQQFVFRGERAFILEVEFLWTTVITVILKRIKLVYDKGFFTVEPLRVHRIMISLQIWKALKKHYKQEKSKMIHAFWWSLTQLPFSKKFR